jgi:D-alanyl-D-alanine carboxypeptidase
MHLRLHPVLVIALLVGFCPAGSIAAQQLTPAELAQITDWYRRTEIRTGDGQWGIAIGTMDGRVLWSLNPELELIPASTAKLFTTGFTRSRAGGGARISTRIIGRGRLAGTRHWIAQAVVAPP